MYYPHEMKRNREIKNVFDNIDKNKSGKHLSLYDNFNFILYLLRFIIRIIKFKLIYKFIRKFRYEQHFKYVLKI